MLQILIAYPGVRVIPHPEATWIALGLSDDDCRRLQEEGSPAAGPEPDICRRVGDAAIIKVHLVQKRPVSVTAWKGLTSCYDVHYAVRPDGSVLIADHFRDILSRLPTSERAPSAPALADHFLYRTIPAHNTYCEGIKRLGRGEKLSIEIASGQVDIALFDRVTDIAGKRPVQDYVDRIDEALAGVLAPCKGRQDIACLFSGGVDSTLLLTYLAPRISPVTLVLPRYDHAFESDYASRVAGMLDLELQQCHADEADYLHKLEQVIDTIGMPPPHLQLAFYRDLYEMDFGTFLAGETADATFGLGGRVAKVASYFSSPAGLSLLRGITPHIPSSARKRWRLLLPIAEELHQDPMSPFGYGAQMDVYTDYPLVEAVFGREFIRSRLTERLDLMLQRVDLSAPDDDRLVQHLEIGQFIIYMCAEIAMYFRHLAHGSGKTLALPFLSKSVFDSAVSVPAVDRFIRGQQGKYLLKELLKQRLPGYDVNQRKGYTHVSFERYYKTGPLSRIWEHYAVPDLFEGAVREEIMAQPSQTSWNAITLAVWEERVRRNADLKPLPHSRIFTWGPAAAGGESADDGTRRPAARIDTVPFG